jgi:hypothetical protein
MEQAIGLEVRDRLKLTGGRRLASLIDDRHFGRSRSHGAERPEVEAARIDVERR